VQEKIIARGVAASPGIAIGIVKVVKNIKELSKVKLGDILVVKTSNPAWTIGMVKSSALISELGGIISHVAIVAREMGIPCIVGVENAVNILKDGQRIKIDGNEGVIYGN
jgi:pyruvate,water dikinase